MADLANYWCASGWSGSFKCS